MVELRELLAVKASKDEPTPNLATNLVPRKSKRIRNKKQCTEPELSLSIDADEESGFMSIVPDEVLLEILVRLPNRQSVFRCITVCKRWLSVIKANKQYLQSSYLTVLFSSSPESDHQTVHELRGSGKPSVEPFSLDFLPHWPGVTVRASCGDLLLVSRSVQHYYICNPLTRQWIAIPEVPLLLEHQRLVSFQGYGLVSEPDEDKSYRIVIALDCHLYHHWYKVWFRIFSSKTGQWTSIFKIINQRPRRIRWYATDSGRPPLDLVATGDGVVHWLEGKGGSESKLKGVVAFDPFSEELGFVKLPCARRCFIRARGGPTQRGVGLGAVGGRLRLARIVKVNQVCFGLRIWELESDDGLGSWRLVHKVSLRRAINNTVFLLAFHPKDGDVVFVACDGEIFRFDIGRKRYEKVGELPRKDEPPSVPKEKVAKHMKVFPLVHSLWPTPVPQLPSL